MNTGSLATRLKRLEFRLHPGFVPPQIVTCIVDSKARVLYKMRLGPGEKQYFSADDEAISKEEAARCLRLRQRTDLP
jgi:hypothetical protein